MEGYIMFAGKVRKKCLVVLIRNIRHAHVGSNNSEPRAEYARAARQEFEQCHGILTARKTDQNTVAILDERIALQGLLEKFLQAVFQLLFFGMTSHSYQRGGGGAPWVVGVRGDL